MLLAIFFLMAGRRSWRVYQYFSSVCFRLENSLVMLSWSLVRGWDTKPVFVINHSTCSSSRSSKHNWQCITARSINSISLLPLASVILPIGRVKILFRQTLSRTDYTRLSLIRFVHIGWGQRELTDLFAKTLVWLFACLTVIFLAKSRSLSNECSSWEFFFV